MRDQKMVLDPNKLNSGTLMQLALDLKIEVTEAEGDAVSPEEAQRRSLLAESTLKERLKRDESIIAETESRLRERQTQKKATFNKNKILPEKEPENVIRWSGDFYFLLDAGWPWRIATYIAWASSPRNKRYPKTQEDMAKECLGLTSDRRICEWRKNNPSIDEAIGLMQAAPLMDRRRDVFEALAASAANPSSKGAQDRKTFLSMTQDYIPRKKVELERPKVNPKDYSEEELRQELEKLQNEDDDG